MSRHKRDFWTEQGHLIMDYGEQVEDAVEIFNFSADVPHEQALCIHKHANHDYAHMVARLIWYMKGNRDDLMMEHYDNSWARVKNDTTPYYNSNYGYYWFENMQVAYAIGQLKKNQHTRQATLVMNSSHIMMAPSVKDKLCTNTVSFWIRNNKLHMNVSMRSSSYMMSMDDIWIFSVLHRIVYNNIVSHYPTLELGVYNQDAESYHIYDKHKETVRNFLDDPEIDEDLDMPYILNQEEFVWAMEWLPIYEEALRMGTSTYLEDVPKGFQFCNKIITILKDKWK